MSDINTAVVDSLKVLDPKRPIREADIPAVPDEQIVLGIQEVPPNQAMEMRQIMLDVAGGFGAMS